MSTPDLPDISHLDGQQLLALRGAVDTKLEEIRMTFIEDAQRLGLVVANGKSKRPRKPRGQREEDE